MPSQTPAEAFAIILQYQIVFQCPEFVSRFGVSDDVFATSYSGSPLIGLTPEQHNAVAAYVRSLREQDFKGRMDSDSQGGKRSKKPARHAPENFKAGQEIYLKWWQPRWRKEWKVMADINEQLSSLDQGLFHFIHMHDEDLAALDNPGKTGPVSVAPRFQPLGTYPLSGNWHIQ